MIDVELVRVAEEDLYYEVYYLLRCAARLQKLQLAKEMAQTSGEELSQAEQDDRNVQLEAFAIHARVLLAFLLREPKPGRPRYDPDDVYAVDYCANAEDWKSSRKGLARASLDLAWDKASQQVGHMTRKRQNKWSGRDKQWDLTAVVGELVALLEAFCGAAKPGGLGAFPRKMSAATDYWLSQPLMRQYIPAHEVSVTVSCLDESRLYAPVGVQLTSSTAAPTSV